MTTRDIFRNVSTYMVINLLSKALSFLIVPYFLRVYTQEQFGQIELLRNYLSIFAVVLSFGIPQAYYFNHNHLSQDGRVNLAMDLSIDYLAIIAFFALVFACCDVWFIRLEPLVAVFCVINIASQAPTAIYLNYLQLENRVRKYARMMLLFAFLPIVLGFAAVLLLRIHSLYLVITDTLPLLIMDLLLIGKSRRYLRPMRLFTSIARSLPKMLEAIKIYPSQIAALGVQQLDRVVISAFMDLSSVGLYSVAAKINGVFYGMVINPLTSAYVPIILKSYEAGEDTRKHRRSLLLIGAGLALALAAIVTLRPLYDLYVGKDYQSSFGALVVLVIAGIEYFYINVLSAKLIYQKKIGSLNYIVIVPAIVGLCCSLLLVKSIGIYGPAAAQVISNAVWVAMIVVVRRRREGKAER